MSDGAALVTGGGGFSGRHICVDLPVHDGELVVGASTPSEVVTGRPGDPQEVG
jgi:uncharacterized protein YbjT (DUF2867 family)